IMMDRVQIQIGAMLGVLMPLAEVVHSEVGPSEGLEDDPLRAKDVPIWGPVARTPKKMARVRGRESSNA
ncbi:hypothetical protein ACLOJK_004443, partial [Asimina triloba]